MNEQTQTQQTINPPTNRFDFFRSIVNLAVQIITVIGLILGAYITIRLAPILATVQGISTKVAAAETRIEFLEADHTTKGEVSLMLENVNGKLINIEKQTKSTNDLLIQHIMQGR